MRRLILLCGAMALAAGAAGKDFPLEFKTLTAQEAMAFPGGAGLSGVFQGGRASGIRKEPPAISKHPLYGQLTGQTPSDRFWFRLDESKGDGKGYDRLIVDLNRNGDLTDDAVAARVVEPASPKVTSSSQREVALFGPIQGPKDRMIGGGRPIYFAQMDFLSLSSVSAANARLNLLGVLRLKVGWYLETTVEFDGTAHKVGIFDGNCNLRLGDTITPTTSSGGAEATWYFQNGDYFLQDIGGSGKFVNSPAGTESSPFGPVLYLGAKPYQAALSADGKSLALDPWSGPLAELVLPPQGELVGRIQVAWESAPGRWQLLQPGIKHGRAEVPPGNYRLYTCTLRTQTSAGDSLILTGTKRIPKDTIKAVAGVTTPFKCGGPLEIKVTSERDTRASSATGGLLGRAVSGLGGSGAPLQQLIRASVVGAGGETYSSFVLEGRNGRRQPPPPTFTITTADGKQVASGNMEFG
jgi:hypothetical protein